MTVNTDLQGELAFAKPDLLVVDEPQMMPIWAAAFGQRRHTCDILRLMPNDRHTCD